ncbi:hypothetical protein [Psychroserpens ponticola]|uniref:Uncharacterized protein n=1 Tax=Psychroserpens ponticola TaxID=2932268 RepID=A0ABY7S3N7_9FLAO|nr:hypothetical protein [Psychroserpens ponticola]WCO03620.1 hypothetical protein MUN68_008935 [Psychroserpens ponticola]
MSKWLLRKASGSRAKYKSNGDFSDNRNSSENVDFDNLPLKESMRNKNYHKTYLDTTLVKRWLNSKLGQDFDSIYSEFLTRIQPKYLDEYRDCIFWYVAKSEDVEIKENGDVWGKWYGQFVKLPYSRQMTFYVNPTTNKLIRISK